MNAIPEPTARRVEPASNNVHRDDREFEIIEVRIEDLGDTAESSSSDVFRQFLPLANRSFVPIIDGFVDRKLVPGSAKARA